MIPADGWRDLANCKGTNTDVFFPVGIQGKNDWDIYAAARAVCQDCPVTEECTEYAISNQCTEGMFGRRTPRERNNYRRNMRNQGTPIAIRGKALTRGRTWT